MTGMLVLHGVLRASPPASLPAPACPGADLIALEAGPFVLVATELRPDLEAADRLFEDPDRAAQVALAHNRILATLVEDHDVAPLSLGSVAASRKEAVALALARAPALEAAFARIAGCVEYVARILGPPPEAMAGPAPELADAASGRAYLARRRTQTDARRARLAALDAFCEQAAERLVAHAREGLHAPASAKPLGPRRLLDLALLTQRCAASALIAEGGALYEEACALGLTFELSGPWPAYSFASPEAAVAA